VTVSPWKRWTWRRTIAVLVVAALFLTVTIRLIVTRDWGDPTARLFNQATVVAALLFVVAARISDRRRRR